MKKLFAAVVLFALPSFAAGFELKGDAKKGEAHYKTLCVSCHGEKGDGKGPAGAAITPHPTNFTDAANAERLTDEWVYKIVKNGGAANGKSPMMISWAGALDDQGLRDVSAFVLTLKPAAPAPVVAPTPAPVKKPAKK